MVECVKKPAEFGGLFSNGMVPDFRLQQRDDQ